MSLDTKVAERAAQVAKKMFEGRNTKVNWKKTWYDFKKKCIQFFGGLLMEKNDEGHYVASMGRLSWWVAFAPAVYIWAKGGGMLDAGEAVRDISPNHLNVLIMLAGYNFGKKVMDTANNVWGKGKSFSVSNEDGPG